MVAIPLAAVGVFVVAILALITLFAVVELFRVFGEGLRWRFSAWPEPFSSLAGALVDSVQGMAGAAQGALSGWATAALSPFITFVQYLGYTLPTLVLDVQSTLDSAVGWAVWLMSTALPAELTKGYEYSQTIFSAAAQYAHDVAGWVWTESGRLITALDTRLSGQLAALSRTLDAAVSALFDYADQVGTGVAQGVVDTYDDAAGYASEAGAYAVGYAEQAADGLGDWVEGEARAGYDALAGAVSDTQAWTEGALRDAAGTLYSNDLAIAGYLTVTLAPAVAALQTWEQDCGTPLCDGLSAFAKVLSGLSGLVEGGLILALVAEAVRDPAGMAGAVGDVAAPVIAAGRATVKAAVGV
ncbi:MAG: hypothetical protein ACRDOE_00240 [Streptosporangiaceae bacterium]